MPVHARLLADVRQGLQQRVRLVIVGRPGHRSVLFVHLHNTVALLGLLHARCAALLSYDRSPSAYGAAAYNNRNDS